MIHVYLRDGEDRMVRLSDPIHREAILHLANLALRYDKVRRYIRMGVTDRLFPWFDSNAPTPGDEEGMHKVVDDHIDALPELAYAKPTKS